MKRTIIAVFALSLLFAAATIGQEGARFTFPEYTKFQLDNGLTVYLLERHDVPMIYLSATVLAGGINDAENYGLADLTANALMFGAGERSKDAIEELIDFHGANLGTGGGLESAQLNASFLAADADTFLALSRDILTSPTFPAEEFEKYRQRRLVQLARAKESPNAVIGDYFARLMFGEHPYGNPTDGTIKTVQEVAIEDLKAFHAEFYRPDMAAVALVGDFNTEAMKGKLTEIFGGWMAEGDTPVNPVPDRLDMFPFDKSRVLLIDKDDSIQTTFIIGGWGITWDNPDYVPISLVNTILGGRFTSWLNTELRIKSGLSYGARSSFNRLSNAGVFTAASFTATQTTERAVDLAIEVLNRLHVQGIDAETLRSGKNYMKGTFPRRFESPGAQVGFLTTMFTYGVDEGFINNFASTLESVTPERVLEVISEYFPKDNFQIVMAGKASAIRDVAAKYGEVTEVKITDDEYLSK